jgi:PAS domain S-box-containing protein
MMTMPALAVVGADHRIIRSTESFRRRYEDAETLFKRSPEIEQVLTGRADVATVSLGDLNVEVEAVTDAAGRRQAMLTLPPQDSTTSAEEPLSALRDAAEDSPAIVWVKDLDGHYLYANPRYGRELGIAQEKLLGSTDADFPETETVDGPRLRYAEDGLKEPLQLEYTVPAIDGRPAMAAFRFPLRDEAGQPIATCGVAAPAPDAHLARDEAVRLMQLERWNRLDPLDVRAEVLEQWHVQTAPLKGTDADAVEPEPTSDPAPEPDAVPEARQPGAAPPQEAEPAAQAEPDPPAAEPEPPVQRERVKETSRPTEATAAPTPAPPPAKAAAEPVPTLSETAELLQTNLQLARKWADRAEQLQGELHAAQLRIREAESEAQQALAAAARAAEESDRWRTELDETRLALEEAQAEAHAARSETEVARGELGAARAQAESLRGPSAVALRLSEELGRALAAERERGDELDRTLARLRSRLTDFETALERPSAISARPL